MSATGYSSQMAGSLPVVTPPAEINATTAGELAAILFEWHSRGDAPEPAGAPAGPSARYREDGGLVAESRRCEQCGAVFVPQDEHARFCSIGCRERSTKHRHQPATTRSIGALICAVFPGHARSASPGAVPVTCRSGSE